MSEVLQKYDLNNLPPMSERSSFVVEQQFLRHIKIGEIPNLEQYLSLLNKYDWACLLRYNPRPDFISFLKNEMAKELDWDMILEHQPQLKSVYDKYLNNF